MEVVLVLINLIEFDDVRMVELFEDLQLPKHKIKLFCQFFLFDAFNSHQLVLFSFQVSQSHDSE